jgi:hypothetical protein
MITNQSGGFGGFGGFVPGEFFICQRICQRDESNGQRIYELRSKGYFDSLGKQGKTNPPNPPNPPESFATDGNGRNGTADYP